MSSLLSRRSFLTSAGAAAITVGTALPARAEYAFRFYHDEEYSGSWVPWLQNVVGYAALMIRPHVINNYVRLNRGGYNLGGGVWDRSNNDYNPIAYWRRYDTLLEYQLRCLQINDFQPALRIRWGWAPEEPWWGRANVGTVALVYNQSLNDVQLEGEFEILLNAWWATTQDSRNRYDVWGGTIAHEMAHNLGHSHGVNEYDDRWPINILDRCVTHNGNYAGGYRTYNWYCGGRLPT
jgi:hypothetical protein